MPRFGETGEKLRHDGARVGRDRDFRGEVRAENVWIDVHVDEVLGDRAAEAARGNLGESRSDREQAVAIPERILGGGHRRAREAHARVQRMRRRKRRKALQRRRDRRPEALGDACHVVRDVDGAPPHEEAGRPRFLEEVDRRFEKTRLGRLRRRGRLEDGQLVDRLLEELEVHRDLDENGAGTPVTAVRYASKIAGTISACVFGCHDPFVRPFRIPCRSSSWSW